MGKSHKFYGSIAAILIVFSFVFLASVNSTNAASTIGTNLTTTGNFEGQNTASAAYFLTGNTIQVGGYASVAYSRFGTSATTHSDFVTTTNDLIINGDFEVDAKAFFDGTASVSSDFEIGGAASLSGIFTFGDGRHRPRENSVTAFRFQNATGAINVLSIDSTNSRVAINGLPSTTFEVQGTASASYLMTINTLQVGGIASVAYSRFGTSASARLVGANDLLVSGQFHVVGSSQFTTASTSGAFESIGRASASNMFVTTSLVVSNHVASSSTAYVAEFGGNKTGTASFLFAGGDSAATGSCFQLKDTVGKWIYMRFNTGATTPTLSAVKCR